MNEEEALEIVASYKKASLSDRIHKLYSQFIHANAFLSGLASGRAERENFAGYSLNLKDNDDKKEIDEKVEKLESINQKLIQALEYYRDLDSGKNPNNLPPGTKSPVADYTLAVVKAQMSQEPAQGWRHYDENDRRDR